MPQATAVESKNVRYRRRLRQAGALEVLFQLPEETLRLIDDVKERGGLRSRSLALLQLIERGREAAQ